MSASEKLAVLVFLGAVASVLAAAAVILVLDLIRLRAGRRGPRRRSWVRARRIVLPLAGSWFQWNNDPRDYEQARAKLAALIVAARQETRRAD